MPITQTQIYVHKKTARQEYIKELATVPNMIAADVALAVAKIKDVPGTCVGPMSVLRVENKNDPIPTINKMYIQDIDFCTKPLCMESAPNDDYFRLLRCHTNMMSGKCKCPNMIEVLKPLFPQYYVKCK